MTVLARGVGSAGSSGLAGYLVAVPAGSFVAVVLVHEVLSFLAVIEAPVQYRCSKSSMYSSRPDVSGRVLAMQRLKRGGAQKIFLVLPKNFSRSSCLLPRSGIGCFSLISEVKQNMWNNGNDCGCLWIILIIILLCCCGCGNGNGSNNGCCCCCCNNGNCGCGGNCGCNNGCCCC